MKLISLELQNFRQHIDSTITFTDGVTGIIGPNGSGKSTILEALAWALYGAPAIRGTNDTIRTKCCEGGAKVNVALTFELGGSIYKAMRTMDGAGRSGSAVLEIDGKPLRSGMSEVSDAITKLLGMDYRAFFTSFFTGQKSVEFMAAMDGRARAAAISKMLGYDRVSKARDRANEDRKGLHREIETMEKGLADPEELKERKKVAKARLAAAKDAVAEAEAAHNGSLDVVEKLKPLKEASDQKARLHQEVSRRLELDRADVTRSTQRLAQIQTELSDLDAKQKELDTLLPTLEKYEQAKTEFRRMAELQKHEGERQRLGGEVAALAKEVARFQAREKHLSGAEDAQTRAAIALSEAESLLAATEQTLRTLRERKVAHEHSQHAQIKQTEWQIKEITKKRDQIAEAGADGACPMCERPLAAELPTVLANFDSQINRLTDELHHITVVKARTEANTRRIDCVQDACAKLTAQVAQLRADKSAADALVAEKNTVREQLTARGRELDSLQEQMSNIPGGFDQARYRELQKAGEELRPVHDRAIALRSSLERHTGVRTEIAELQVSLDSRKNEIAKAEQTLSGLAFSIDEHEKLQHDFDAASTVLSASVIQLERQKGEAQVASVLLLAIERDEAAFKSKLDELKNKRSERLHLQTVAEALDKLRADLNDRIRPELEAIASELLSIMTDGRYNTLEISDSYQAVIRDDGELKQVISGGEEDIVNLALRLAISQMIADRAGQSFSLLILDEVFGSLDDVRRDNVVGLLQNLKNRFEQIILITHVESIHDAVDNCLWVSFEERTKTSRLIDHLEIFEESEVGIG
ncbi:MAG: SMC family ATPase [Armatimonadota bacterium]